jgi:lipopolysaccharide assembly outer membrane protein LptD (OstA)
MSAEFYRVYDAEALSKISDLFKVSKWMHIIEPSISYQYSPPVSQSHIPVYDEVDRIPYTNQITYGLTQRLMGKPDTGGVSTGAVEYARLKIFQSYSLSDPSWFNSQFIDSEGKKRSFSNIEGQLWLNFSPYVWATCDTELNPYRGGFDLINVVLGAKDRRSDTVTVGYSGVRSTLKGINFNARVKTISPIYLFGTYYYDLLNAIWVYWMFGAEYQTQCWSAGFLLEDINQSLAGNRKQELKYSFYLNLLNIGSFGKRPYFMKM